MKKISSYLILTFLAVLTSCYTQHKSSLSNSELTKFLTDIDTLEGNNNYHVILKKEDKRTYQLHIWINDRNGEEMYETTGIFICRYFPVENSYVYVYEFEKCRSNVPSDAVRKKSNDQYAYLSESPFFVENGFYKIFLVKRLSSVLDFEELDIVENDVLDKDLQKALDF